MTTTVDMEAHDAAVLGRLRTLPNPVGYAEAPEDALDALRVPPPAAPGPDYLILYPLPGGSRGRDGTLADPHADAELLYQVTIVARLPEGARNLVAVVEAVLAGVTVEGRSVLQVSPEANPGVRIDESLGDPPVFYATPIWRLSTTPG